MPCTPSAGTVGKTSTGWASGTLQTRVTVAALGKTWEQDPKSQEAQSLHRPCWGASWKNAVGGQRAGGVRACQGQFQRPRVATKQFRLFRLLSEAGGWVTGRCHSALRFEPAHRSEWLSGRRMH